MSPVQRTKSGCWTCRLRRKKCQEGGPPCANCRERGILCHGYGPKPDWKDRGDREKEEAGRLQLQTRRHRPSTATSSSSAAPIEVEEEIDTTEADADLESPTLSPFQSDLSMSMSPPSHDRALANLHDISHDFLNTFDLANMTPNSSAATDLSFVQGLWHGSSPAECTTALVGMLGCHPPIPAASPKPQLQTLTFPATSSISTATPDIFPSESDIELIMQFIDQVCPLHHPALRMSPPQKGWLLFLLTRSQTFYHASLAISSYHISLGLSGSNGTRVNSRSDYQAHRAKAADGFCELANSAKHQPIHISPIVGETLICAVQLAILEALGKNMQSCYFYFTLAAQTLGNADDVSSHSPDLPLTTKQQSCVLRQLVQPKDTTVTMYTTIQPSPMELKSTRFFCSVLIWNDVLSCSVQKRPPETAEAYRTLLSDNDFALAFQAATGCESWIFISIMDTSTLEAWKCDQESHGNLSIRELVKRAAKIESTIDDHISKLNSTTATRYDMYLGDCGDGDRSNAVQTSIFAHALLTHIHSIISGSLAGVPEIHQSINATIQTWFIVTPPVSLKSLAWPYCVSASLAAGAQRDFFRDLFSQLSPAELTLGSLVEIKSLVETCWKECDDRMAASDRNVSVDWRDVTKKLNSSIVFM
ncbi:fungal-specific transcription factor domain-containing protein [Bombardia bombarda]|uniref:Fungal-specific transcription factor domain-containing protein n=1 Tax=Bombardia bombarda TaxID=252184 RepID=A0AA40BVI3_9PEZI|nr:fungal-specific transcription factor domain-containing protein [Bombardia bombarda]